MNKQQRKILFKKILPISIALTVVLSLLMAFIIFKIWAWREEAKLQAEDKEMKEWLSVPENRAKWDARKNKLKNYSSYNKSNYSQDMQIKTFDLLSVSVPNGWDYKIMIDDKVIDLQYSMIQKEEVGYITLMSQTPHQYIHDLKEHSDYLNEKLVRNMKPTGIILTSNKIELKKWKGVDAVIEYYDSFYTQTGEETELIAMNFKYKNKVYTINYSVNDETISIINSIELK